MNDVERALEALKGSNTRTRFFLRRELGKDTEYFEINGHIFDPNPTESDANTNKWCRDSGCECAHPSEAEVQDCPANAEGFHYASYERRDRKRREWEDEHDWGVEDD